MDGVDHLCKCDDLMSLQFKGLIGSNNLLRLEER